MKKIYIEKEELEKVYNSLKNQKKVAEHFNVSLKVIRRLVKEYNLDNYNHKPRIFLEKEIIEDLYSKHTKLEIAKIFGVNICVLNRHMDLYKIKSNKSPFKNISLTENERDIIIGSLLGDGCIRDKSLEISHGKNQLDYLNYKKDLLTRLITGNVYERKSNGIIISYRIRTGYIDDIENLKNEWYLNSKKIIPKNITISPLALAIWYLDDGGKRGKTCGRIATCCFSEEEVKKLRDYINNTYDLETRIHKETKYFNIYIPSKSFKKFCEIIKPYVPQCMEYKISFKV